MHFEPLSLEFMAPYDVVSSIRKALPGGGEIQPALGSSGGAHTDIAISRAGLGAGAGGMGRAWRILLATS